MSTAANMRVPEVDIVVESPLWTDGDETTVRRALEEAATALGADFRDHTLSVLLTDDAAIQKLNARWRGIDKPTNVLSFPAPKTNAGTIKPIGDIAIAFETTVREAKDEAKPLGDHLAHLSVHGFLHLMGYDHETDSDAETMERLERVILARLGVGDPYASPREAARV